MAISQGQLLDLMQSGDEVTLVDNSRVLTSLTGRVLENPKDLQAGSSFSLFYARRTGFFDKDPLVRFLPINPNDVDIVGENGSQTIEFVHMPYPGLISPYDKSQTEFYQELKQKLGF
jgi:hypothetical protein